MPSPYLFQPPPYLDYDASGTAYGDFRAIDLYWPQCFDQISGKGLNQESEIDTSGNTIPIYVQDSFGIVSSSGGSGPAYTLNIKYINCDPLAILFPTICTGEGDLRNIQVGDFLITANRENSGDPKPYNLYSYYITDVRSVASGFSGGTLTDYTATIDIEYIIDSSGKGTSDPVNHQVGIIPGYGTQYSRPISVTSIINVGVAVDDIS